MCGYPWYIRLFNHQHFNVYFCYRSGLLNFAAVALALNDLGYRALGIRIDSGDLAYLSRVARESFVSVATKFDVPWFAGLIVVASNDINEDTILSLNDQGHSIDCFGIGTHLVTCQRQPALGCVYKLVEINGMPKIKLSQDVEKVTMPGKKIVHRLYSNDGHALIDLLQKPEEDPPEVGKRVLCRHPFHVSRNHLVIPDTHWTNLLVNYRSPSEPGLFRPRWRACTSAGGRTASWPATTPPWGRSGRMCRIP